MLIETAIISTTGTLTKKQFSLDDIRTHESNPANGFSVLSLRQSSQFAMGGTTQTYEAFEVLSERLATLSESKPVALMSSDDWSAAQANFDAAPVPRSALGVPGPLSK